MFVISGVSGHVGSAAATELLAKKAKVRVLVRDPAKGKAWSEKGAEVAVGDLNDQAFLTGALKGASGFFVLSPPNFAAPDFYAYQRELATHVGAAVKAAGVPYVVLLSSIGADLSEGNGPVKGLFHLEKALRDSGAKYTFIRAGSFQENFENVLGAARGAGIFPNMMPSADYPIPQIATKDIGTTAAHALLSPPEKSVVVDLHGPAYTTRQVAEKVGARLGKTLEVVDVPAAGHVEALKQGGMSQKVAEIFAEMYAGFASGKMTPKGDKLIEGKTTLDETIAARIPA